MQNITQQIALEIGARPEQVQAAIELLDGGATVPFVARYRKEATGGLSDVALRELHTRLDYLRQLQARREVILGSIQEQGKLTPQLQGALQAADTKQALEDLYLPYKPKRRTKGQIAKQAGLEPLAERLLADATLVPAQEAQAFVHSERNQEGDDFTSVAAVLQGARDILSERWAEDAVLVQSLRSWLWAEGVFSASLVVGKDPNHADHAKFRDYFSYDEPIHRVPSHRALAVFRGRKLEILDVKLALLVPALPGQPTLAEGNIARHVGWRHQQRAGDDWLGQCIAWCWRVKLSLSLERDLFTRLREEAEQVAIKVFADNLRDLLLAAPAGPKVVMGLDPGIRTGVKVAVVDSTGTLLDTATVYPHEPRKDWDGALHTLGQLCQKYGVNLIAIGNGTASRETDKLAVDLIKQIQHTSATPALQRVVVSESGASVYSASELASQEMPDVDVSLRGAASIARRLQDPLAELVKIDPQSIGVGQYQHDLNQSALARSLEAVVEDCVNRVGVDLNTASAPLLARVSGLSASVAQAVVHRRQVHGPFSCRNDLLQVTDLGAKIFEQCAGFLRLRSSTNPLDATGVHPETYPVVEKIMAHTGKPVAELMGRSELLKSLRPELFVHAHFGLITVQDVLAELEKPGRDPRPDFQVARFNDGVEDIQDLQVGMVLQGTVSNVAAFGAFVDVGVHQDGLVHVSELADRFVTDAHAVVKTGDIVKVRVLQVDALRKRISLSMKLAPTQATQTKAQENAQERAQENSFQPARVGSKHRAPEKRNLAQDAGATAMASAFGKLAGLKK